MGFEIKNISTKDKDYIKELELRLKVLGQQPIALDINNPLLKEEKDFHFLAYLDKKIVGCCILTILNENEIKMRQVGVDEKFRGKGIGTKLIKNAEDFAKQKGYKKVMINARRHIIPLYEKFGYSKIGAEFIEVGIPHIKMYKDI